MTRILGMVIGGGAAVVLLFALLLMGPVLLIWSINWLAESGGASFYIDHTLWNYWVALVFIVVVRGGSGDSK